MQGKMVGQQTNEVYEQFLYPLRHRMIIYCLFLRVLQVEKSLYIVGTEGDGGISLVAEHHAVPMVHGIIPVHQYPSFSKTIHNFYKVTNNLLKRRK